jgi:hypothetical protein
MVSMGSYLAILVGVGVAIVIAVILLINNKKK